MGDGEEDETPPQARILRRAFLDARRDRRGLLLLIFISLLSAPISLALPLPLKVAVDSGLSDRPMPGFLAALVPASLEQSSNGIFVIAAVLQVVIVFLFQAQFAATTILSTTLTQHMTMSLRGRVLAHAQRLSFSFHDERGTSDALYRIQYDTTALPNLFVYTLIPLCAAIVTLSSMLYVIFAISLRLALLSLGVVPFLVGYYLYFRRRMFPRYAESKRLESSAMQRVHETLGALRVVKSFGREDHEYERFMGRSRESAHAQIRLTWAESTFFAVVSTTIAIGTGLVLFVGIKDVRSGLISLGSLLLILGYLRELYRPLESMTNAGAKVLSYRSSLARTYELLDAPRDVPEHPRALPLERARGHIQLIGVSFGYQPDVAVLDDVHLDIPAGTRVGIAGRTGSGKTTLVSLLTRFFDPTNGMIMLDGRDVRRYRIEDLRQQFSIVMQDAVLFSASIGDNIAYARPNASHDDVIRAAKAAEAHDFITQMADGYETLVGERGLRLSGGERQRISLARAFLRDAPIVILDEPTSAVDTLTEKEIMTAFSRLMADRTVFMIAHRLSTLDGCDEVIRIDDGRVTRLDGPPGRRPRDKAAVQAAATTAAAHRRRRVH